MAWSNGGWKDLSFEDLSRSIAPGDVKNLRNQLKDLKDAGIIKETQRLCTSRKEVKEKINMTVKFCMDYLNFNHHTLPDMYNERKIEEALNCLVGNRYFSVVGIVSGMFQYPSYPGERDKPYSIRPLGFYETERMQPGYCEALSRYHILLEYLLKDINMVDMVVYLDYILIFGETWDEHRDRIVKVSKCLDREGFKASMEKSAFCRGFLTYAGHMVSDEGITIDPRKVEVMSTWPKPRTISELRCFLDFCRYYQQFVKGFSKMAKPLNKLLQKAVDYKELRGQKPGVPWWQKESIEERWTKECDEAVDQLKHSITHAPVLQHASLT